MVLPESSGSSLPIELTSQEEAMVKRIDAEATLRVDDVFHLIELGITQLERPTSGTAIRKGQGSERANRQYRCDYLHDQLGIDAVNLADPNGKRLSERLVADVAFDLVGLCMTVEDLNRTYNPPAASAEIELFNQMAKFRQAKAERFAEKTLSGETRHERGMEFQYSVGRSDNPAAPGEFAAILTAVIQGLKAKKAVPPPA
ncbi:hypothetical protein A2160_04210 [Candidatus Beckwithbacteria bacterium RBG_13_42_9]|uniref:Uncharacterized protein n=1 Tax=Candidatus Beckwithbacteria bacterium RBG_13_42_9 TaxID=1797457 RepID=A0A1F5E6I5_9BACT|nr:MAG: hypothetical protein A2160_04210 [Candidatus Beckwithbacteria bacterium RBG_13_42_9]